MNGNYFPNEQKLADDYETPQWLFDILNNKFHFSADMACDSKNCRVPGSPLFDKGEEGLDIDWSKYPGMKYVFPPFSKPYFHRYLIKAHQEWRNGESSVVVAPIKTISVDYFQNVKPPLIYLIYPRIKFIFNGRENHAAESICLLIYNAEVKEFATPNIHFTDFNRFAPNTYKKL